MDGRDAKVSTSEEEEVIEDGRCDHQYRRQVRHLEVRGNRHCGRRQEEEVNEGHEVDWVVPDDEEDVKQMRKEAERDHLHHVGHSLPGELALVYHDKEAQYRHVTANFQGSGSKNAHVGGQKVVRTLGRPNMASRVYHDARLVFQGRSMGDRDMYVHEVNKITPISKRL